MSDQLNALAKRVDDDPFFLACALRLYAEFEQMNPAKLAATLGCAEETLTCVQLCRMPAEDASGFQRDVDAIAARFGLRAEALAEAVRRGQVLLRLRSANDGSARFMAARDRNQTTEER